MRKMEQREKHMLWCDYKGRGRRIFPATCEWHQEMLDAECDDCHPEDRVMVQERDGRWILKSRRR